MRSLTVRILALAALNLLLLAVALLVFVRTQMDLGVESILLAPAQPRLRQLADEIAFASQMTPRAELDALLARFARQTDLTLSLWENDTGRVAGAELTPPEEFRRELRAPAGAPLPPLPTAEEIQKKKKKKKKGAETGPLPVFLVTAPDGYWFGIRTPLTSRETTGLPPGRGTLIAHTRSLIGHPLLFNPRPWIGWTLVAAGITVICWLPFIRNLARAIRQLRDGAARLSEGQFDARVPEGRRDEVGALAEALNRMGKQLGAFVHGQRRFLGDVAHELTAPLARAQMAVGILEERPGDARALRTVREEVDQISALVNELLQFSRAGYRTAPAERTRLAVGEVARRVIDREGAGAAVTLGDGGELQVLAHREGLERALGNLVRNALRYAGESGPITISARTEGSHVVVTVADCGPGLPEDALDRVFAPFFRLDDARTPGAGGTGLGLAIVKAAIESSGGTVWCRNRSPRGLEVSMRLDA